MSSESITSFRYCIIIPTFNNERTLKYVIDGVLQFIDKKDIIIVNDGATDSTQAILNDFPELRIHHFQQNQGKGMALRKGFELALENGYTHAITIDSDGQHYPDDIPSFIEVSQKEPETLFIGSRDMTQENVPNKSSFGNKFSNFWFWFETGIKLEDTQSGYRIYPLFLMPKNWYTKKFEFEIECIVRSAWDGIDVKNHPVKVKYDPEERVSHFRPFRDFTRISILNTVLVTILFFYIIPRNFWRNFKKKSFKDFIKEDVLGSEDSPEVKSISLALGIFIGIIPIWGFHTVSVLFLSVAFRLNKLLAVTASNISIPPMIPIIVFASAKIGSWVLNTDIDTFDFSSFESLKTHLLEYILGSFILALVSALLLGSVSYLLLKRIERKGNG